MPTLVAARHLSSNTRSEGSVASSKGFSAKEKAQEDQYARKHEVELLKKLRKEIEAKKSELASLEQQHAEEASKTK
jgi:hypothetical protein